MSPLSPELSAYLHEVRIHAANTVAELDELAELCETAPLSNRDYYALERYRVVGAAATRLPAIAGVYPPGRRSDGMIARA
jgi:hypothetical protein